MHLEKEHVTVRNELIAAGIDPASLTTANDIQQAVRDLYHADPDANEPLTERLLLILHPADAREEAATLAREFAEQPGLKGCPDCHQTPTITGKGTIACEQHPGDARVGTYARSFAESVVSWNDDESWIRLGANPAQTAARPIYPLPTAETKKGA